MHAIEQDDFTPCGGDVYARGHLRTLARAVHLDPAPLLAQYDDDHGGRPAPTPAAPLFEAERIRPERRGPELDRRHGRRDRRGDRLRRVHDGQGRRRERLEDAGRRGIHADRQQARQTKPTPTKPADPKPDPSDSAIAAAPQDKVTVQVSAPDGRSWISAKDHNGRLLFDGLLKQGDSKTFQDKEKIDLVLGDAGAHPAAT